jgi:DNA gyrase/topoisomerase IV subunit A
MQYGVVNMTIEDLMEVLNMQTQRLTQLLSEKKLFTREYEECKDLIHELTDEIDHRKKASLTNYYYKQHEKDSLKN